MHQRDRKKKLSPAGIMLAIAGLVCAGPVASASNEVPDEHPQEKWTKYSIEVVGLPDAKNDIQALIESAPDFVEGSLEGTWTGEFMYGGNSGLSPYTVILTISSDNGRLHITSSGPNSKRDRFEVIDFTAPVLRFTYLGFLRTPKGKDIPLFAELVLHDDRLIGLYKRRLSEVGGKTYYANYDVTLVRQ